MKIKHLLIGLFAAAAAVACQPENVVETPKLDVDKTAVSVAAAAGEASFNVTSNQDWTASADADWVSVDPATGKASDKAVKVAVTAEDNETTEARSATVTVKAGSLTKTVKVTQAAGQGEEPGPGPEPGPDAETYLLVGDAVGGWNFDNPVVLTLTDGYYVAKEVGVTGEKDMHFTKNSSWEGNVKGLHGRIAPNEIGEVGNNNISLTVGGAYDIYLTEALDKFYFMTPGKLPSEAVEHVEIETVWGVCGALDGNSWGASSDPVLTAEGEWLVARNVVFTEVNFKVRGNNTWADDLKWGRAAEDQVCELNKAIAVSTCTEYRAANPDAGDNPNIYIGGSGTYDIYFSEEKKEVWVMTPGYKPGDETPAPPVTEKTYTVTGTIEGHAWENGYEGGLMTAEGDYLVAKNLPLVWGSTLYDDNSNPIELKVLETGTWNGYGAAEEGVKAANAEIAVAVGGGNIVVDAPAGTYDVYFDQANEKVWVMTAGSKPGDAPVTADYDIDGKQWMFTWTVMGGASCVIDLGVTEPGTAVLAYDMAILDPSYAGIYYPYMVGSYTIAKTDGTSGVVTLSADGQSIDIPYSNCTENTVHFATASLLEEEVDCTLATSYVEISLSAAEGLADGEYWIIADNKVATPITEKAYGYLNVVDAVDGKSTAANAFTFTQVEAGLYTIQDSNGKYYYQTGTYNSFNVSDTDGGTDEYLWEVYDSGNGQFVIMNYEVGKFIQYDPTYSSYGSYSDERGVMPTLVLAEDPIAEPETPSGSVTFSLGTASQSWIEDTHAEYGTGYVATVEGFKIAFYQNASQTAPSGGLKEDHIRVYQGSNLVITSTDGKKIKSVSITCTGGKTGPISVNGTEYAAESGVITWTGDTDVFDANCVKQTRVASLAIVAE